MKRLYITSIHYDHIPGGEVEAQMCLWVQSELPPGLGDLRIGDEVLLQFMSSPNPKLSSIVPYLKNLKVVDIHGRQIVIMDTRSMAKKHSSSIHDGGRWSYDIEAWLWF